MWKLLLFKSECIWQIFKKILGLSLSRSPSGKTPQFKKRFPFCLHYLSCVGCVRVIKTKFNWSLILRLYIESFFENELIVNQSRKFSVAVLQPSFVFLKPKFLIKQFWCVTRRLDLGQRARENLKILIKTSSSASSK